MHIKPVQQLFCAILFYCVLKLRLLNTWSQAKSYLRVRLRINDVPALLLPTRLARSLCGTVIRMYLDRESFLSE